MNIIHQDFDIIITWIMQILFQANHYACVLFWNYKVTFLGIRKLAGIEKNISFFEYLSLYITKRATWTLKDNKSWKIAFHAFFL